VTVPETGVVITTTQMYQELRSLSNGVTRVETKLDGIAQGLTDLGKDVADHETRIRVLEQKIWRAAGSAAVLAAGGGLLAQYLIH
jgi:septal ring factor EnvC (AmiA/AmiB activator)